MLEVVDLKKSFGGREILHCLNLTFESGVYGLLGPNGAGKSTLMNIITGLLRQTSGQVLFHGVPASDRRSGFAAKLGYLPQQPGYYKNYTAAEFLRYLSALKGIRGKNEAQIAHLLEFVNLSENADQKLGTFSGGMLRRAGLAQALLGKPEVVILDEPTAGLDPLERIRLRNLLAEIAKGRTVIVATHIVPDVEFIANQVILMFDGQVRQMGKPEELAEAVRGQVWQVRTDYAGAERLSKRFATGNLFTEQDACVLRIVSETQPTPEAVPVQPTLEDAFLRESARR